MYVYFELQAQSRNVVDDLANLAARCRSAGISGWARPHSKGIWARFGPSAVDEPILRGIVAQTFASDAGLERLRESVRNDYAEQLNDFLLVPAMPRKRGRWRRWRAQRPPLRLYLDGIDLRHRIHGWAIPEGQPHAEVEILIDDELIGETTAKRLRRDLLLLGTGNGTGELGYAFAVPERFLDGREHTVLVRRKGVETPRTQRKLTFPKHFKVNAPWRSTRNLGEIQRLRTVLAEGYDEDALRRLVEIWNAEPSKVFFHAGIAEYHERRGTPFLTMRERLDCRRQSGQCPELIHKLNSKAYTKAFCAEHDILTAKTLLVSGDYNEITQFDFPERYVVKPTRGSKRSTFLMDCGFDRWSQSYRSTTDLLDEVQQHLSESPDDQFVIEQLWRQRDSGPEIIPVDYKLHVFAGRVRAIQVVDRNVFQVRDGSHAQHGWFAADWSPSPGEFRTNQEEGSDFAVPEKLDELTALAERIGRLCEDYVRVDLYDTDEGIALGEVTPFSHAGRNFTQFGDAVLSQAWHVSVLTEPLEFALPWTLPEDPRA